MQGPAGPATAEHRAGQRRVIGGDSDEARRPAGALVHLRRIGRVREHGARNRLEREVAAVGGQCSACRVVCVIARNGNILGQPVDREGVGDAVEVALVHVVVARVYCDSEAPIMRA